MRGMNTIEIIEQNNLIVGPALTFRDGNTIRTWSVARIALSARKTHNVTTHVVAGAPTVYDALAKWLSLYGPNPSHGIKVGDPVRVEGSAPGIVLKIGKWFAVVGSRQRVPALVELSRIEVGEHTPWKAPAEDIATAAALDCDNPDQ